MLRTHDRTVVRTDGRMDDVKTVYLPTNAVCGGIIMRWARRYNFEYLILVSDFL